MQIKAEKRYKKNPTIILVKKYCQRSQVMPQFSETSKNKKIKNFFFFPIR